MSLHGSCSVQSKQNPLPHPLHAISPLVAHECSVDHILILLRSTMERISFGLVVTLAAVSHYQCAPRHAAFDIVYLEAALSVGRLVNVVELQQTR